MTIGWRYPVAILLATAMLALLLRLGFWQLSRAEYKEAQSARWQQRSASAPIQLSSGQLPEDWLFRAAQANGEFNASRQFLLDNRTHAGRAGYHVLTPFNLGSVSVLVNRGWIEVGPSRAQLPALGPLPDEAVDVSGSLVAPPRPGLILGSTGHEKVTSSWPRVVQTIDLETMAAALGQPLLPALLRLSPSHPACHRCVWAPIGGLDANTHRGYALQWFSLAAALVALCAYAAWRSRKRNG